MQDFTNPKKEHRNCIMCGGDNHDGLQLQFSPTPDGVVGYKTLDQRFQGYPGIAQGGIVAGILDSAMTNYLFEKGIRALTAKLNIRYRNSVPLNKELTVTANLKEKIHNCYILTAKICMKNKVLSSAEGYFIPQKAV
jgi:hypothetical protein